MENVLITGITGRSGKRFYETILNNPDVFDNYRITVVVRNKAKADSMLTERHGFNIRVADIDNQADMKQIFTEEGITTLFHIVGIYHSYELVKTAIGCGVNRLILVHTTGIFSKYKAAGKEYVKIEQRIRDLIEGKDISLNILRPTMIYGTLNDGNISQFIRMVDKLRLFPILKKGTFALQPVHHRDLAEAYFQVMVNPDVTRNKDYNLSGGTVVDLIDILKHISMYLNKKTVFFPFPYWLAYAGSWALYLVTFTSVDYREKVQRLIEPRAYSNEDARRDFGYAPINFYDGLKDEVEEYIASKQI